MNTSGIIVDWGYGTEYVPVDVNSADSETNISMTKEWWHHEKRLVEYFTVSEVARNSNGSIIIKLDYNGDKNQHLSVDNLRRGTSIIKIDAESLIGEVEWHDFDDESFNGKVNCTVLTNPKQSKRTR